MPASATNSLRVAVLADSDTRWKWGALTANRLAPEDADIRLDGFLLRGRATPTARQLQEVGVRPDSLRAVLALIVLLVGLQMGLGLFVPPADPFAFAPGVD